MLQTHMPDFVAESLRRQAQECLRASQVTRDPVVRNELLAAAAWLHEEAVKIEKLLRRGGGGGPSKPPGPGSGKRGRALINERPTLRYQLPGNIQSPPA